MSNGGWDTDVRPNAGEEPMTIDEAVAILNRENHRHYTAWELDRYPDCGVVAGSDPHTEWLTEFEAVAIAEKYLRGRTLVKPAAPDDTGGDA